MALTLEDTLKVRQRTRIDSKKPGVSEVLRALFKHLQALRNPDLQFVAISGLNAADLVIANVACRLYAAVVTKPAASVTDAWFKISDHATVAAANGDVTAKLVGTGGGSQNAPLVFPDGLLLATGATAGSHTTVNGNVKSALADAPTGFAIVGAQ